MLIYCVTEFNLFRSVLKYFKNQQNNKTWSKLIWHATTPPSKSVFASKLYLDKLLKDDAVEIRSNSSLRYRFAT